MRSLITVPHLDQLSPQLRYLRRRPPTAGVGRASGRIVIRGCEKCSSQALTGWMSASPSNSPVLSVGLAVRNGSETVERCIESVLSQDFADLELIVSDNASDDETIETVESYARMDRRVRLSVNRVNLGAHNNMNRVLAAARGTYFRWISADDWLEPGCLSACVRALERQTEAIGVTSWFTIHTAGGPTRYEEYGGEFPTSPDPARRFERMLWFFHAGDAKYDPVYGVYRRDRLVRSHRIRPSERTDWLLSAELALMGPILHLHERLAHRTRDYPTSSEQWMALRRRLDPHQAKQLRTSPRRLARELFELAVGANLNEEELRRCRRALRSFWVKEVGRVSRLKVAEGKHRLLAG
jgi:Glycosyl transferase family 2